MVPSSVGRNNEKLHIPFGMFRLFSYLCAVNSFRPLSKRLTYRIMVVVLVMIVVITGIVYFHVGHYMFDEAQERYEGALQRDHEEFRRRLSDVMVAAKNNIEGRVIVQFVIDETGQVGEVKVVRPVSEELDAEAVRVVKTFPKFEPGRQDGEAVSVWYTLPIMFKIQAKPMPTPIPQQQEAK